MSGPREGKHKGHKSIKRLSALGAKIIEHSPAIWVHPSASLNRKMRRAKAKLEKRK